MEKMTIVRHSQPSSLDQAAYGSKCIVKDNHGSDYELYIQTSKDEDRPKWDIVGIFNDQSSQFYIDQLIDMRLGV
jgi:hypothetical protein